MNTHERVDGTKAVRTCIRVTTSREQKRSWASLGADAHVGSDITVRRPERTSFAHRGEVLY